MLGCLRSGDFNLSFEAVLYFIISVLFSALNEIKIRLPEVTPGRGDQVAAAADRTKNNKNT